MKSSLPLGGRLPRDRQRIVAIRGAYPAFHEQPTVACRMWDSASLGGR